jgi:uncharacterized protein (DUF1810 family)
MGSESELDRFKRAQEAGTDGFDAALREVWSGQKHGHWIWYVFPQLAGLGQSQTSREYGVRGIDEATAYLRDPVLCRRLTTMSSAVLRQLEEGEDIRLLLGSDLDAMKLASSMTLFAAVARTLAAEAPRDYGPAADLFELLLRAVEASGYPPCEFTLERLRAHPERKGK